MTSVLERLFTKRKTDRKKAANTWEQLVFDVAMDSKISIAQVDERLDAAGKSELELKEAVETFHKVQEAKATYRQGQEAQAKMIANEAERQRRREEMEGKLKKLKEEGHAAHQKFQAANHVLQTEVAAGDNAHRFLLDQPRPEAVQEQLDALAAEKDVFRGQCRKAKEDLISGNVTSTLTTELRADYIRDAEAAEAEIKKISNQEEQLETGCFE